MKKKIGDLTLKEAKTICDSRDKKGYPYASDAEKEENQFTSLWSTNS